MIWLSSVAIVSVLIMGGCSDKNKGADTETHTISMAALDSTTLTPDQFKPFLAVDNRKVSETDAERALTMMGLNTPREGQFSWNSKRGKAGDYSYKNLTAVGKDGEDIKIAELNLTGVHMSNDAPTFDRIDVSGLDVTGADATLSLASMSLSDPSPALGASILEALQTAQRVKDLSQMSGDLQIDGDDIEFGALLMTDLTAGSTDGTMSLSSLGWGEDDSSGKAIFLVEGIKLSGKDKESETPVNMSLDYASATGIDSAQMRRMRQDGEQPNLFSPYNHMADGVSLKNFKLSADTLNFTIPSITTKSDMSGSKKTIKQVMDASTLSFSAKPTSPDLVEAWTFFQQSGYESLQFSGSSTTIIDETADTIEITDSRLSLKDGFDLNFSMTGSGLTSGSTAGEGEPAQMLNALSIGSLNLSLTDKSIVDRVFNAVAAQQGNSPSVVKMLTKTGLMGFGFMASGQAETKDQQKLITEGVNALSKFLDSGGKLTINLNPAQPLPAGYFSNMNPQDIDPVRLGLTVEHTP